MRQLFIAVLVVAVGQSAFAQRKISPRVESFGGNAYVVVIRPGADMARARELVRANRFDLIEHPDLRPNHLLVTGPRGRLARVGASDDVAYILPASPDLVARERVVACAGAVVEGAVAGEYVEVGRGWPRDASGVVGIRYYFQSLAAGLDEAAARGEIERAFREWQKYGAVTFTAGDAPDAPRTIAIRFEKGAHGDSYPFDGPGASLAHTFYPAPPNAEPIAGDMHFDASENWHIGTSIDLFTVALHEAGHALGLGHSDQPGAVMYPYYRLAYGLTADDIAGIEDLYGAPGTVLPLPGLPPLPTPGPDPLPTQPPGPVPPATPPAPPVTPGPSADRTPPTLRIASPVTTNVATTAATLTVSGSARDDTGVVAVKWTTSSGESGVATGTVSWAASVPLYVGTTVITVRAYDASGNSGWRAITVSRR